MPFVRLLCCWWSMRGLSACSEIFCRLWSSSALSSCLRARSFRLRVWEGEVLFRVSVIFIRAMTLSIHCVLLFLAIDHCFIKTPRINALCAIHSVALLSTNPLLCRKNSSSCLWISSAYENDFMRKALALHNLVESIDIQTGA